MIAEIKNIVKFLPINPGFKFIEDPSPNAFALPISIVPDTQGTVYIGLNLINGEFNNSPFGGVAVAGICAHECGHIFQYKTGYERSLAGPTPQLVELHADFLAGYYLGRSRAHSKEHVQIFAQSLFSRGDYNFNSQQHHGTPDQRVRAMSEGYDTGASNTDASTAARIGADFVRRI
jgi:predicted metalloprotease